mgnify:CR=1 FL=1
MLHSPGCIAFAEAENTMSRIVVDTVGRSHVLQRRDGRIVVGGGKLEVGGTKSSVESQSESTRQENSDALFESASRLLPKMLGNTISIVPGERTLPKDGLPVVGFTRSGVYSAITHSGITLGPLIGSLAATEIVQNVDLDLLANYRPSRFGL